jgi:hypothetical protein
MPAGRSISDWRTDAMASSRYRIAVGSTERVIPRPPAVRTVTCGSKAPNAALRVCPNDSSRSSAAVTSGLWRAVPTAAS